MSKDIVYSGQSFINKVIECTGSIENVFAMALLNGVSITDEIVVGSKLKITPITSHFIVGFFDENNKPANNITNLNYELLETDEGIGAMIIEDTFIVR